MPNPDGFGVADLGRKRARDFAGCYLAAAGILT